MSEPGAFDQVTIRPGGLIGRGIDRYEGSQKVTGAAPYAHDVQSPAPPVHGYMVPAASGLGRVARIDTRRAAAAPDVLLVWTYHSVPEQGPRGFVVDPFGDDQLPSPAMPDDHIRFFGDTVALVVAETFEAARAAAGLIEIEYAAEPADVDFAAAAPDAPLPPGGRDARRGDFEAAFAEAPHRIDGVWTTPLQNHLQLEPHATVAWWDDDRLTIHNSNQMVRRAQRSIAATLQIDADQVHLLTRFVGGGFGGKVFVYDDGTLAAMAARELGRPVKLAYTRRQMFHGTVHRPATIQRVRLGADDQGHLTALSLISTGHCGRSQIFVEPAALFARGLYAAPNRLIGHRLVHLDLPNAGPMRAPGEAPGTLTLECAMDELAERVGIDPVELRIRNEPEAHPETGREFSIRQLSRCMREGALRFGWAARAAAPKRRRDGEWWLGMGMASAIRGNMMKPAQAQITIDREGLVTVRQGMTDIGTGTYTILAQIVAESLGVGLDFVRVELGDSDFPPTPGSGGQFGGSSAASAVLATGFELRRELAALAVADPASALYRCDPALAEFNNGNIAIGNHSEALALLVGRAAPSGLSAIGSSGPGADIKTFSQQTYGAQFAEVAVNAVTGEIRVRRMLGVFAAGRIINLKTATSQLIGGMIWGLSSALFEGNAVDVRFGSLSAQDMATYLAPTHADVNDVQAHIIDEVDERVNALGMKGVGELGICGSGAAIANAVYNAIGVRFRDYPLTPDKVIPYLDGEAVPSTQ